MRVAITGASGLIGSHLAPQLRAAGHEVVRLVRSRQAAAAEDAVFWSPAEDEIDVGRLEGVDAVVHLAGESLFGRWTEAKKARIVASRVEGSRLIARAVRALERKPSVVLSSSGVNYYGDTGQRVVDEDAARGEGFLSDLCQAWEDAVRPVADAGVRLVHARTAVVLTPDGGALARLLPVFRAGMGGRLGSGRQWMSWIALDDALAAIHHALAHAEVRGPMNLAAPAPVTNAELTATLGRVLSRPTVLPVPGFALATLFGRQAAEEMFLHGPGVTPRVLRDTGFGWSHPTLEPALRHLLR